jgi:hypothetical protein
MTRIFNLQDKINKLFKAMYSRFVKKKAMYSRNQKKRKTGTLAGRSRG